MSRIIVRFKKNGEDTIENALGSMIYDTVEGDLTLNDGMDNSYIPNLEQVKSLINEAIRKLGTIVNSVQGHIGVVDLTLDDLPFISELFVSKAMMNQPEGVAGLDEAGKIIVSLLPKVAITSVAICSSLEDRNLLTPTAGDVAIVDEEFQEFKIKVIYIYTNNNRWQEINRLNMPNVSKVNGRTGEVILTADDVGLGLVKNYPIATLEMAQEYLEPNNVSYMTPLRTKDMLEIYGFSVDIDGNIFLDGGAINSANGQNFDLILKKGTTEENEEYTGKMGSLTFDTERMELRVHDGSTKGGLVIVTKDTVQDIVDETYTIRIVEVGE